MFFCGWLYCDWLIDWLHVELEDTHRVRTHAVMLYHNPNSNLDLWPFNPQNRTTSSISQGHSLYQVWILWDHSFLSYAPDKQTNRQTDRQTVLSVLQAQSYYIINIMRESFVDQRVRSKSAFTPDTCSRLVSLTSNLYMRLHVDGYNRWIQVLSSVLLADAIQWIQLVFGL